MADKPELRAYALRADAGELSGATTSYGDGLTFDIKAALDEGNGTIVVNDNDTPGLSAVLDVTAILKGVPVPEKSTRKSATAQEA